MISAAAATNSTAPTGTRLWLSFVQMRHPGTARSRENANVMRDALVTQAMPQNSWPTVEMRMIVSAHPSLIALVKIAGEKPNASSIAVVFVAANVIASSTIQPITAE